MISSQRIIIMVIALNVMIAFAHAAYTGIGETTGTDILSEQSEVLFGITENSTTNPPEVQSDSAYYQPNPANQFKLSTAIKEFGFGLLPWGIRIEEAQGNIILEYLIQAIWLIRSILDALLVFELYLILINKKTS